MLREFNIRGGGENLDKLLVPQKIYYARNDDSEESKLITQCIQQMEQPDAISQKQLIDSKIF